MMSGNKTAKAVGVAALVGLTALGGWYGVKKYLHRGDASNCPGVVATPDAEAIKRLQNDFLGQQKIIRDLELRLQQSVMAQSDAEIQKAKAEGRFPKDKNIRPGTSLVTAIGYNEVWVRDDKGKPTPYKIGDVVPSAGKLLAIDWARGEAIAELTYLRVTEKAKDANSAPSKTAK